MTVDSPLLVARDIAANFPGARRHDPTIPVLHGISLEVRAGEMLAIVGPSGSGKSTLLACLAGLHTPSAGSVLLDGEDPSQLSRRALARCRRDRIGFVFQSFNLVESLSARDNIALVERLARRRVRPADVMAILERLGLRERARHRPAELSGGEQQRVALGRVLLSRPRLVFADEPTGALDSAAGNTVLDLLRELPALGGGVVLVTHDLDAAARADRVVVLRDGRIGRELHHPTAEQIRGALLEVSAVQR